MECIFSFRILPIYLIPITLGIKNNMKTSLKIVGYIVACIGVYFTFNDIEYFLLMNQILLFLGMGLVFYADKNIN